MSCADVSIGDTKCEAIFPEMRRRDVINKVVVATDMLCWRTHKNSCNQKHVMTT